MLRVRFRLGGRIRLMRASQRRLLIFQTREMRGLLSYDLAQARRIADNVVCLQ